MSFLNATFHQYPEIAIYLTLALGFWFGNFKIGKFSLGIVTSTLLAGLLIGQLTLTIPAIMESTFFDMFLFAVGYAVGPQFIRAIKSDGLPQVIFTVLVCFSGLGTAIVLGKLLHYNGPLTAGLLSGGYTNSTVLGVASSLYDQSTAAGKAALALIPVAYAVTYPFGTAGSAWLLSSLAPKLMGIDLVKVCIEYEQLHGSVETVSHSAYTEYSTRAFQLTNPAFFDKAITQIEALFDHQMIIRRIRNGKNSAIDDCQGNTLLLQGAILAVSGTLNNLVAHQNEFGPEVKDIELLNFPTERLDIVVNKSPFIGKTLGMLAVGEFGKPGQGVFLLSVTRADHIIPLDNGQIVQHGDVLSIRGAKKDVDRIAKNIGYADRALESSDMAFMCFGIVIGCIIGAITIHVAKIPLSLGTSVGSIVAGIFCGYLRATKRTFGRIPAPAIWIFNNVGLNGFIAVVGLNAAPGFILGLQKYGITLFLSGMVVTLIPLIFGLIIGKYVFKFHPAILFGVCAGARSTTAALGALQEAARSKVPAIGYTVGYAVSRLMMAVLTIFLINVF